jgi:hypothetical protein
MEFTSRAKYKENNWLESNQTKSRKDIGKTSGLEEKVVFITKIRLEKQHKKEKHHKKSSGFFSFSVPFLLSSMFFLCF